MHIDVNGTRLWFDVDGPALVVDGERMRTRPTVLLVHGGPGGFDHSYFKPDFSRLAHLAQVVYLDLRSHGRSARDGPEDWDYGVAADDLRAFCDALGIARPVVLGHSFGGPVVIAYGARHPGHSAGLVLQSTVARFDLERAIEDFRAIGGDEIAEIVRRSYSDEPVTPEEWNRVWPLFGDWVPGDVERTRIEMNLELSAVGGRLLQQTDVTSELGSIEDPTLVCVGELDPITPVAAAREMAEAMKPGVASLEILPGAGHFPWKDTPDAYWSVLERFVVSVTE
jgi:proline iminopeptidase